MDRCDPTFGQERVELRYKAGHEDGRIVCQKVIALVVLGDRVAAISLGLSLCAVVGLKMKVSFGPWRGGHVGNKCHQIILIVWPKIRFPLTTLCRFDLVST